MSIVKIGSAYESWDGAIREAKKRIESLQAAVRVFEKNKLSGEPWPGDSTQERTTTHE